MNPQRCEHKRNRKLCPICEANAKAEKMRSLLQDYIDHFDNPNWSDGAVKEWLDSEWIPTVRELLAE